MLKITLVFVVFFLLIWFITEMLKYFGGSKLFRKIFDRVLILLLLTALSIMGIIWLF